MNLPSCRTTGGIFSSTSRKGPAKVDRPLRQPARRGPRRLTCRTCTLRAFAVHEHHPRQRLAPRLGGKACRSCYSNGRVKSNHSLPRRSNKTTKASCRSCHSSDAASQEHDELPSCVAESKAQGCLAGAVALLKTTRVPRWSCRRTTAMLHRSEHEGPQKCLAVAEPEPQKPQRCCTPVSTKVCHLVTEPQAGHKRDRVTGAPRHTTVHLSAASTKAPAVRSVEKCSKQVGMLRVTRVPQE